MRRSYKKDMAVSYTKSSVGFVHKKHGLYSHFVIIYTRRKIESGVCRIRKVVSIS